MNTDNTPKWAIEAAMQANPYTTLSERAAIIAAHREAHP